MAAVEALGLARSGHAHVADIQRARMITAMFEVACECGAANATVGRVVERSGVSRRTFYETFTDCEECLEAAFEEALAQAGARVLSAYRSPRPWIERVRAGLVALLAFFDEQPTVGRLLVVESLAAGPRVLRRRARVLAALCQAVDEGREHARSGAWVSPLTAESVVGGALAIVHARLLEPAREPMLDLAGSLMGMVVLPYLGSAAARRELGRPAPVATATIEGSAPIADPFKAAGMRLTYRTVRALLAVAEAPGASNRAVARVAEVKDAGQISKLLSRLERAGLTVNSGLNVQRGAPNAWMLTAAGRRVTDSIRAHAQSLK